MPRDGSGTYTYPPGTPGIPDTTIESAKYNAYIADIQQDLNLPRPIVAGGTGANNVTTARDNLDAEVAGKQVTNYDSHVFENGSFYSDSGATGAPDPTRYFVGTARLLGSNPTQYITLDVRTSDGALTDVSYTRQKVAGVWKPWTKGGAASTGFGDIYFGNDIADMSFGLSGTAPNSFFFVNSESDASGNSIFQVNRAGPVTITSPNAVVVVNSSDPAVSTDLYFAGSSVARWLLRTVAATGDLVFGRFDGAGTALVSLPLKIGWSDGIVSLTGSTGVMANATPSSKFEVRSEGGAGDGAFMAFVRSGYYAANLGIDTDNNLKYGGWSAGAVARRVHFDLLSDCAFNNTISIWANAASHSYLQLANEVGTVAGALWWYRTDNSINLQYGAAGGSTPYIKLPSDGKVQLGNGFAGKIGQLGAYSANCHNFYWASPNLQAYVDNSALGNVTITSDYRIKKDVLDLPGMWDTVKALRPIKYTLAQYTPAIEIAVKVKEAADERERAIKNGVEPLPAAEIKPMFEADDIERWGFIAHELQETLTPSVATGVKDDPKAVQSLNIDGVVAALTKALQEAQIRIEALEAAQAAP